ncbi:Protein SYM1 [Seminavis robusta]|uniref:Protein SYM1 n=1 Tax=Seminavis robusta TaxID=568900 RepID=A0A9N8DNX8_9STRA|nr:Protein SYM1 [Seminavis robusta]|eukprot:Sro253_g099850.1 Protein SYM1 (259) ;mRNA; r:31192-32103
MLALRQASTLRPLAGQLTTRSNSRLKILPKRFSSTKTATNNNAQGEKATKKGFVEWYEGHLESRPVVTKMLTGCCLWGLGDIVAQVVPHMANSEPDKKPLEYDFPRTGRAVLFGFALHAPTSHVHFNFLEWLTHRVGVTGLGIPVFKAFMEQFVYWGWISNAMYLGAMGAMQGHSPEKITTKIHDSIWGLMKAQWAFWVPVQLLNFRFIPVRHQLNVVLVTSIVWTALLSFWYPPEKAIKAEEETTTTTTTAKAAKEE